MVKIKICLACSGGGHLAQIFQLKKVYKKYSYFFLTFKRFDTKNLKNVYFVEDPKRNPIKFLKLFFQSFLIALKEKPDIVLTTGAGVVIPFCIIIKFFGKKLIYIESFSRIKTPSLTGKILYPIADLFLVQWVDLLKKYDKKAKYEGMIF